MRNSGQNIAVMDEIKKETGMILRLRLYYMYFLLYAKWKKWAFIPLCPNLFSDGTIDIL